MNPVENLLFRLMNFPVENGEDIISVIVELSAVFLDYSLCFWQKLARYYFASLVSRIGNATVLNMAVSECGNILKFIPAV